MIYKPFCHCSSVNLLIQLLLPLPFKPLPGGLLYYNLSLHHRLDSDAATAACMVGLRTTFMTRGSHPHRAYATCLRLHDATTEEIWRYAIQCCTDAYLQIAQDVALLCAIYTSGVLVTPRSSIVTSAVPMCYLSPSLMAGGQRFLIMALLIS